MVGLVPKKCREQAVALVHRGCGARPDGVDDIIREERAQSLREILYNRIVLFLSW
jgi:hypothetical protein